MDVLFLLFLMILTIIGCIAFGYVFVDLFTDHPSEAIFFIFLICFIFFCAVDPDDLRKQIQMIESELSLQKCECKNK